MYFYIVFFFACSLHSLLSLLRPNYKLCKSLESSWRSWRWHFDINIAMTHTQKNVYALSTLQVQHADIYAPTQSLKDAMTKTLGHTDIRVNNFYHCWGALLWHLDIILSNKKIFFNDLEKLLLSEKQHLGLKLGCLWRFWVAVFWKKRHPKMPVGHPGRHMPAHFHTDKVSQDLPAQIRTFRLWSGTLYTTIGFRFPPYLLSSYSMASFQNIRKSRRGVLGGGGGNIRVDIYWNIR